MNIGIYLKLIITALSAAQPFYVFFTYVLLRLTTFSNENTFSITVIKKKLIQ